MLKFGFLGFGQAGGIFVNEAKKLGYPILAFNTARVDLSSLSELENDEKVHLSGYEGAGKDRSVGQEAFYEHHSTIVERINEQFENCHVLFPVFSLGGGTGSGMSSLIVQTLVNSYESKVISPIVFMPASHESPRSKMNALESFSDISTIKETGALFMVDNQKVMDLNQSISLREKYKSIRTDILSVLHTLNCYTAQDGDLSNFDDMDLLTVLSERGSALLSQITIAKDDVKHTENIGDRLLNSWKNSIFANTDFKNISKAAVIAEISSELTANLTIEHVFSDIGTPLEIFTGIFENEQQSRLTSLITGLPYSSSLLKGFEENVEKDEKRILEVLEKARQQSFPVSTNWTETLKRERKIRL